MTGPSPRLARAAAVLLTTACASLAAAAGPTLHGEVGVDAGVRVVDVGAGADASVPLRIRARLELEAPIADRLELRAVALPAIGAGFGDDDPLLRHGLQEATLRLGLGDVDLSAGYERWPLGEARLAPVLRLDGTMEGGEARGLLGARATAYLHPWRLRAGLAAPTGDDLAPDRWGGAVSLRLDAAVTVEGHAFLQDRAGGGLQVSGTAGALVLYGEAWLLADPWEARGGAGASGYAGDVLWTLEAAWAPADGALRADARAAVRGSGSLPVGRDGSLELGAGLAWPEALADPGARATVADGYLAWTVDHPDATLSVRPTVRHGGGVTAVGATLSITSYF